MTQQDGERRDHDPGDRPIVTNSRMWQSPRWTKVADTVFRRGAKPAFLNHPLLLTLRLLRARSRYAVVVTSGSQVALLYGLLCRLLALPQKQVVVQLYLNERRGLLRALDPLTRLVLRRAWGVIVNSRGEIGLLARRFGVPPERVRFVYYHTNIIEPELVEGRSGVVFAGGRNFRDYETLVDALRGLDLDAVIVCGRDHLLVSDAPDRVRIRREIPYPDYLEVLRQASIVVVPLSTETVPAGQVAILEAMALGKPVVTTRGIGTVDYVRDGIDGLLYARGDAADLRRCIVTLAEDSSMRSRMGRAALASVQSDLTFDRHVEATIGALRSLVPEHAASRGIPS
ncbi:MAG: glycosyltransferase family 4 protein [Chloroflexi bacterium]|nr:MAG: glycosyltransferase family 4 protein [Chloroflexota bacterium]